MNNLGDYFASVAISQSMEMAYQGQNAQIPGALARMPGDFLAGFVHDYHAVGRTLSRFHERLLAARAGQRRGHAPQATVVVKNPNPQAYDTAGEAGIAAIQWINPLSISNAIEYGGLVYWYEGKYYFTDALTQNMPKDVRFGNALNFIPDGGIVVGAYHTHGIYMDKNFQPVSGKSQDGYDSDRLSSTDAESSAFRIRNHRPEWEAKFPNVPYQWRDYLGTPSRTIFEIDVMRPPNFPALQRYWTVVGGNG